MIWLPDRQLVPSLLIPNMSHTDKAASKFDNILNFRDVGEHINKCMQTNGLKTGILYRSAKLDNASTADRSKLLDQFHIWTVIDLRSKTELINAAKAHSDAAALAQSAAVPAPEDFVLEPLKIPGLDYREINLNGKGFERSLIWQLRYTSLARLIFNMALGYRIEGIAILGREVMLPRGLVGLGLDTLDHSGPEIKQVFDVLSDESAYPLLIHCTQGKDRTGISIILALLLCDVKMDAIVSDYTLSEPELESEKEQRMKEIRSIGLDESFAKCPPQFCQLVLDHLNSKYGGIAKYLEGIGVGHSQQQTIRQILLR
jgi:protein-tyrosine phosphatase